MTITVQVLEVAGVSMPQEMNLLELKLLWSVTVVWGNFFPLWSLSSFIGMDSGFTNLSSLSL